MARASCWRAFFNTSITTGLRGESTYSTWQLRISAADLTARSSRKRPLRALPMEMDRNAARTSSAPRKQEVRGDPASVYACIGHSVNFTKLNTNAARISAGDGVAADGTVPACTQRQNITASDVPIHANAPVRRCLRALTRFSRGEARFIFSRILENARSFSRNSFGELQQPR